MIVVEAMPCTFDDIPNDSLEAIHGLLASRQQASDRIVATPLDKLKASPFYNMLIDDEPTDKSLALLQFTQRSNGKQLSNGFRVVAERVRDATIESTAHDSIEHTESNRQCAVIAFCTVEKSPDFTAAKGATALAVISRVSQPSKPEQHAADLYIEAMEIVSGEVAAAIQMMHKLHGIAGAQSGDPNTSQEKAWQQRKCRRLLRYPTQTS